jgi:hypothetical protein
VREKLAAVSPYLPGVLGYSRLTETTHIGTSDRAYDQIRAGVSSLHPPRPVPSETSQVRPRCMRRLPERPVLAGETSPLPCKADVAMMAVSGSPAWVVRRGEQEVSAGGPQEG